VGALQQDRAFRAGLERHFHQPLGIGGVGCTDHNKQITARGCLLDGFLAVGRGVADRFCRRRVDQRKLLIQPCNHVGGVINRQGGLGDKAKCCGIRGSKRIDILDGFHQRYSAGRQLPHGADDFGVTLVTDQNDMTALAFVPHGLFVDLGNQWTGGVKKNRLRCSASAGTDFGTPWAEKITGWL
jgi:hypothetical protein